MGKQRCRIAVERFSVSQRKGVSGPSAALVLSPFPLLKKSIQIHRAITRISRDLNILPVDRIPWTILLCNRGGPPAHQICDAKVRVVISLDDPEREIWSDSGVTGPEQLGPLVSRGLHMLRPITQIIDNIWH
jgi:hypothetical protein